MLFTIHEMTWNCHHPYMDHCVINSVPTAHDSTAFKMKGQPPKLWTTMLGQSIVLFYICYYLVHDMELRQYLGHVRK